MAACSDELPALPDEGVALDQQVDQAQSADSTLDASPGFDMPQSSDLPQISDLLPLVDQGKPVDLVPVDITVDLVSPDMTVDTVSPPNLAVTLAPLVSPLGWLDVAGQPTLVIQSPAPQPGLTYECRIARPMDLAGALWGPCDGDEGDTPKVQPPNSALTSGTYTAEVRALWGQDVSPVVSMTFSAHETLNNVPTCPQTITDARYFLEAKRYLTVAKSFSTSSYTTKLTGPFIQFYVSPPNVSSKKLEILSLRRRFIVDSTNRLILITRRYESRLHGKCVPGIRMDTIWPGADNPRLVGAKYYERRDHNCDAVVLNAEGAGICFLATANGVTTVIPQTMPKAYKILIDDIDRLPFSRKSRSFPTPQHHIYLPD